MNTFIIKFDIEKSVFEDSIDPRYYIDNLKEIGRVELDIIKENIPEIGEDITPEHGFIATVILKSDASFELLRDIFEPLLDRGVIIEQQNAAETGKQDIEQIEQGGDEAPHSLVQSYFIESADIITRLNTKISEVIKDPGNSEKINELFREFHTLKGGTGVILSYGENETLEMLKNLTQASEGLLHRARDEKFTLDDEQLDLIQSSIDRIDDLLNAYEQVIDIDLTSSYELIDQYQTFGIDLSIKPQQSEVPTKDVKLAAVSELVKQYLPMYDMILQKEFYDKEETEFILHSFMILEKFKGAFSEDILNVIDNIKKALENKDFKESSNYLAELGSSLKNLCEPLEKEEEKKTVSKKETKQPHKVSMLRVNENIINDLMSLVGEITVFKEWFGFFVRRLERKYEQKEASKELKEQHQRFKNIVETMQNIVLDMRMVPLSTLFERYPKLVRDLSKNLGKRIVFKEEGGDTLLDKMIIEKIGEPMIHLIRNSIDHGIEQPDIRKNLGKDEEGHLTVQAFQKSGKVYIKIIDDGGGIDAQRVKRIAIERGFTTPEKLESMSESDIQRLVLLPGFSTKQKATELSGRGVGTDAILTAVQSVSGELYLESQKDKGTTVMLELPLTIAMQKILLFKLQDEIYGIPANLVGEIIKVKKEDISFYKDLNVFIHRDVAVEVENLRERLHLQKEPYGEEITLLIDSSRTKAYAVDKLLSTIDTVVKPTPAIISSVEEISGVTILGDGTIVYILSL